MDETARPGQARSPFDEDENSDGLPQEPEYPTEEDVRSSAAREDNAAAPAVMLAAHTPQQKEPRRGVPPEDSVADTTPKAAQASEAIAGSRGRFSPSALRAMSEQRRLARLQQEQEQQQRSSQTSEQLSMNASEEAPASAERTATAAAAAADASASSLASATPLGSGISRRRGQAAWRDVGGGNSSASSYTSRSRERAPSESLSPTSIVASSSASPRSFGRRSSLQSRRELSMSHEDRQLHIETMFLVNHELEGRNGIIREEGDELAEILRQYKIFAEEFEQARLSLRPIPSRDTNDFIVDRLNTTDALRHHDAAAQANTDGEASFFSSSSEHDGPGSSPPRPDQSPAAAPSPPVSSASSPLFTITTVYRRGLPPGNAGVLANTTDDSTRAKRESAQGGLADYPRHTTRDEHEHASKLTKRQSFACSPSSRTRAKPAILYVQLPPSWWLSLSDCGSTLSSAAGRVWGWLLDACVALLMLLCVLALGTVCDVAWLRVTSGSE